MSFTHLFSQIFNRHIHSTVIQQYVMHECLVSCLHDRLNSYQMVLRAIQFRCFESLAHIHGWLVLVRNGVKRWKNYKNFERVSHRIQNRHVSLKSSNNFFQRMLFFAQTCFGPLWSCLICFVVFSTWVVTFTYMNLLTK